MAGDDIAIRVENVSKTFKLPHEKSSSIKTAVVNFWRREKGYELQEALNNVSFDVKKGEFFGIVGRNGSGKSTLLKLLAGIYTPDAGTIQVNGKLTPFIELGVGFNPELTGRENVFLNGALLGFGRKEMSAMYKDIVEFAELERFMDQKLKNYSSGMQVRLAFSIAIRANTDILVLDEVLAVGDEAFQRKCNEYFSELKKDQTKTVILVTHSMSSMKQFCDRAALLGNGEIITIGTPEDVANGYSLENNQAPASYGTAITTPFTNKVNNIQVKMLSPEVVDEKNPLKLQVSYDTSLEETGIYISLVDVDRNVPLYDCPLRHIKGREVKRSLKVNITEINDVNIKVQASIRDNENNIVGFLPEEQLPKFLFRRKDFLSQKPPSRYGIINNYGKWE